MNALDILQYLLSNDLINIFPNLSISLRILLTMPVTVATGERSFSKLKIIKNYLRSTMKQERLTNLSIISIEREISRNLDITDIVNEFSIKKSRKVQFN
ncbi:Zinc finger MYM-type protein 1 [Cyphomyrmex costatus]|uniref:Zinc finger MYM-type protein 1 n=1 Tax=Cyphomyrmex costatus TaxID=456900 RepID=A0A151IP03_9HYME|nr:Zinc finger MYM-type protein 1 [Cyphomyrmex costatus]